MICFTLCPTADLENCWELLSNAGFTLLYSSEDPSGNKEIYADYEGPLNEIQEKFPFIEKIAIASLGDIDWTQQWALHGADFRDGYVHVQLSDCGCDSEILLKPGPGFGDLSHPTTNLVLNSLKDIVKGRHVLDVGCGSGILSLAAAALGAISSHGIDIDPEAILHARENALINQFQQATFGIASEYLPSTEKPLVILMNMILTEQVEAWKALHTIQGLPMIILTSGILKEGRTAYLEQARKWGWELKSESELQGWLGFHFTASTLSSVN